MALQHVAEFCEFKIKLQSAGLALPRAGLELTLGQLALKKTGIGLQGQCAHWLPKRFAFLKSCQRCRLFLNTDFRHDLFSA